MNDGRLAVQSSIHPLIPSSITPDLDMARNRKYQSAAIRFGPAIKAFLLCVLIGGSGVGYVWQKSQINELGTQISKREHELAALRTQNEKQRKALAMMYSLPSLEARIKELNLGLVPQPSQVWRLTEPAADPPKAGGDSPYVAQQRIPLAWR